MIKELPCDIREYNVSQLETLAKKLRSRIVQVCAKNGGHLAPSLGTVDLTLAILKIFDPLKNPIVWDVGHQSYAYKILTGRNKNFDTLRQFNGISGFNNIFESPYDAFSVGHSSTSVSAALGISATTTQKTVAIIGDGALTSGMSFEGINNAGHLQKNNLIVILNDNEMSISKNVGALQKTLTNFLVSKAFNFFKKEVYDISNIMPENVRKLIIGSSRWLEGGFLRFFGENTFFKDLGFNYVGPVNGHNIPQLIKLLSKINKNVSGPVLLHVITQKGKGYKFSEANPSKFHGIAPFDIATGEVLGKSQKTYAKVFGQELMKLASKNKNIYAIVAAMTDGVGLAQFAQKYPKQFFDVGIAEQHAVTFAAGLAVRGKKPFVAIYSTFAQRAFDQIIHDVAMQKLPVVFCLDRAGLVGEDGATHHGVFDLSYLSLIPNLIILTPSCESEFTQMLVFAAAYTKGPIAIRYSRGKIDSRKAEKFALNEVEIVEKGEEIAICTIGTALFDGKKLLKLLFQDGHKPSLINFRALKPLDKKALEKIREKFRCVITIEENVLMGGFGEKIASNLINNDIKVYSFGFEDKFVLHGEIEKLKEQLGLLPKQIYKKLKDLDYDKF